MIFLSITDKADLDLPILLASSSKEMFRGISKKPKEMALSSIFDSTNVNLFLSSSILYGEIPILSISNLIFFSSKMVNS